MRADITRPEYLNPSAVYIQGSHSLNVMLSPTGSCDHYNERYFINPSRIGLNCFDGILNCGVSFIVFL